METVMNYSDVFGGTPSGHPRQEPPGLVNAPQSERAGSKAPARMWVGLVVALVALRVIYEMS